jgi:hypothetical protein
MIKSTLKLPSKTN